MRGRFVITFWGGIVLFGRFMNSVLGFVLFFSGVWIYGLAYLIIWLMRRTTDITNPIVYGTIGGLGSLLAFLCLVRNCYKLFISMPDNHIKRFLLSFVGKDYRPEREGNNIPENMMFTTRERIGFFFGAKIKNYFCGLFPDKYSISKPTDEDGHILVVGGAGSGKSSCIAIPTLKTWGGTIFVIDIKGELSAYYDGIENPDKKPHIIFDPTNPQSKGYDPYYLLRNSTESELVQNAREIALSIIPLPPSIKDPFWVQSAQNVLTGAILYYFGEGLSFTQTITAILTTPIDKLIDEIAEGKNLSASLYVNQARDLDVKVMGSIATQLSNHIIVFATDPLIRDALSKEDCFRIEEIENNNIFLRLPEDKLQQWSGAVTLIINQLIRTLERRADKTTVEGKKQLPILLLLDEFPRLGKVEAIKGALATLRSKAVTICLVIQSLAQLDETYGKDARRTILDNCPYKAILKVTDADSQSYFSHLSGSSEVEKKGYSENYDADVGIVTSSTESYRLNREPIIFPHEYAKLKDIVLMTPEGFCRVDKAPYYKQDEHEPQAPPPMKLTDVIYPVLDLLDEDKAKKMLDRLNRYEEEQKRKRRFF